MRPDNKKMVFLVFPKGLQQDAIADYSGRYLKRYRMQALARAAQAQSVESLPVAIVDSYFEYGLGFKV